MPEKQMIGDDTVEGLRLWSAVRGPQHIADEIWGPRCSGGHRTWRSPQLCAMDAFSVGGDDAVPAPPAARSRRVSDVDALCYDWDRPTVIDGGALVCVTQRRSVDVHRRAVAFIRHDACCPATAAMLSLWLMQCTAGVSRLDVVAVGEECHVAHGVVVALSRALTECNLAGDTSIWLLCVGPRRRVADVTGVTVVSFAHDDDLGAAREGAHTLRRPGGATSRASRVCCGSLEEPAHLTPLQRADLYAAALSVVPIVDM